MAEVEGESAPRWAVIVTRMVPQGGEDDYKGAPKVKKVTICADQREARKLASEVDHTDKHLLGVQIRIATADDLKTLAVKQ